MPSRIQCASQRCAKSLSGAEEMPAPKIPALREKLADLPTRPGCYLFKNAAGTVIYVGRP